MPLLRTSGMSLLLVETCLFPNSSAESLGLVARVSRKRCLALPLEGSWTRHKCYLRCSCRCFFCCFLHSLTLLALQYLQKKRLCFLLWRERLSFEAIFSYWKSGFWMVFSEIVSKQTGFTLHKTHTPQITANSVMRRIMRATLLRQVPCNFKIVCKLPILFVRIQQPASF